MPRTLDETYERILDAVQDSYFEEVRTVLAWLAFSVRPLAVAELAEACSIRFDANDDTTEPYLEEGEHDALVGLFDVISPLILVGEPTRGDPLHAFRYIQNDNLNEDDLPMKYDKACYTQVVRLAHFSVKEYLVSSRLQQSLSSLSRYALREMEVHWFLSQNCCAYFLLFLQNPLVATWIDEQRDLIQSRSRPPEGQIQKLLENFITAYPLLYYATCVWAEHQTWAETGVGSCPTRGKLHLRVLESDRTRFAWFRVAHQQNWGPATGLARNASSGNDTYDGTKTLYWASLLGLKHTVSFLSDHMSQQEIRHESGGYHTALHAAAYCGHETIMEMLIARGADVNCAGGELNTPLQAAAQGGHEKVVDALLANGADVNIMGGKYGTALSAASSFGHERIVSRLLKSDIHPETLNFVADKQGSALELAARKGHTDIVQALLQAGANHGSAIMEALKEKKDHVVRLLVAHGADLNMQFPGYSKDGVHQYNCRQYAEYYSSDCSISVLEWAVQIASDEIVQEILDAGADATTVSREVLMCVAKKGFSHKFNMLVDAGAEIEHSYNDVLEMAVQSRSVEIVELLVRAGVKATPEQMKRVTDPPAQVSSTGGRQGTSRRGDN